MEQTVTETSSVDKQTDGSNKSLNESNEDNTKSRATTSMAKQKPEYKTVESRYKQSTQQWVNRRAEDSHQSNNSSQGLPASSRPPSRNPTPERKMAKKSSTPLSNDKSLNLSGVSVINPAINQNKGKPSKTEIKKYSKPLITGRKSIASKRLPFDSETNVGRAVPLTGIEIQNKEFEESIKRSIYAQTMYLNAKSKLALNSQKADAFAKISAIWKQTNEMRDKLSETQKEVQTLETLIEKIDILEKEVSYLKDYTNIRSKVDPIYNTLSELIGKQKKLLKIDNCSEEDFAKMTELLESCPDSQRLESVEKATIGLQNMEEIVHGIKLTEEELEEYHKDFDQCVKELEKYERIENQLFPEKALTLRKLF